MQRTIAAAIVALVASGCLLAHGQSNVTAASTQGSNHTNAATAPEIPTPTVLPSAPVPQEDIVQFARRQIDLETQRLDKLVQNTETVGKLLATFVVAFAAFISFFGFKSFKEFKEEVLGNVQASVQSLVDKTLEEKSQSGKTFEQLVQSLSSAQSRWAKIEESLANLAKFEALNSAQYGDAHGAYAMAKALAGKDDISPDERRTALGLLLKIVELGEQGKVDPNLLFNACSAAAELDFDHEALKLATLCAHWDPKPSHVLRRSRHEDTFGLRFEMKDHVLAVSDQPPAIVRAEAWNLAKDLVGKGQRFQCELILSDVQNIAMRNRESGYIDEAIPVLKKLTKEGSAPSYAYVILSDFYAMRGDSTWLTDYLATVRAAVAVLSTESPASTWYQHSIRDLLKMAERAGKTADVIAILKDGGIGTANQASEATSEPAPSAASSAPQG
jgi:hypothetical protein